MDKELTTTTQQIAYFQDNNCSILSVYFFCYTCEPSSCRSWVSRVSRRRWSRGGGAACDRPPGPWTGRPPGDEQEDEEDEDEDDEDDDNGTKKDGNNSENEEVNQ